MKEAKVEAEQIIAAYRAEMESAYQKKLMAQTGSSGAAGNELTMKTEAEIDTMKRDFNNNKAAVEKMLIDVVTNVKIQATKARGQ